MTLKRKMIQCVSVLNRDAVRRETIDGVEHIIVSSFTMPDNIVMNGVLYPAEEIANSFKTLERTLAPVEHPQDADGNFISATDPHAIHNFYAGAYNLNVSQVKGRVHVEKHINVQEAIKTDRGKRLMDRIKELETNEKARPIHTSAGIFLAFEETDGVQVNDAGDQYTLIASEMIFDHDAILLDSVAAASPSKGVGMAVNLEGDRVEVERVVLDKTVDKLFDVKPIAEYYFNKININADHGLSHSELADQLDKQLNDIVTVDWFFIVDIFDDVVIFETNIGLFQVAYTVDNDKAMLNNIPIRVEREVTYIPVVNLNLEGGEMKDLILNALKEAGINIEGMDNVALFAAYNELQVQVKNDAGDMTVVVANAIKPLVDKIDTLENKLNSQANDEVAELAKIIGNSDKFPDLGEETAKKLPVDELQKMAANCGQGYGVSLSINSGQGNGDDRFTPPTEMPD